MTQARIPAMILSALVGLAPAPGGAGPTDNIVAIEVLPGWDTADGTRMAGLRLTLAPGWKTYWRAPGDAGIPPEFTWAGSRNIAAAQFHWPVPEVFDQNGMRSIGYAGQVVIPIELTPASDGAATRMAGAMDIGVCHDVCVPMTLSFDMELPAGGGRDPAIAAALIDRPLTATEAHLRARHCTVTATEDGLRVTATLDLPRTGAAEAVVIEAGDAEVWVSEPDIRRDGDILIAEAEMVHVTGAAFALDRSAMRITVLGSDRAVDIVGCPAG